MKNSLRLIILIASLLTSCGHASLPTPTTVPVTPTITLSPTPTAIPTATPYPSLQTNGPYLLFTEDKSNFTIMDADGTGLKKFQLPNNGYIRWDIDKSVSPDGKWIVYFTGSAEEEPYDLALHLFNIYDGTSYLISNLIAPGFPENLEPVIETAYFAENAIDCIDPKCRLGIIQAAFKDGVLHSIDWSPNSQSLAFAAQIDGSSSDIYIFNIESKSIRRLTNELENIWAIDWSPSGEKILYLDSKPGINYTSRYIRIANPDIQAVQTPNQIDGGLFWGAEGWINDDSYFLWNGGEGGAPHNFRYINTKSKQVTVFWKYESDGFSFLSDLGGIVVIIYPNQEDTLLDSVESGTYFVSMSGERTKLSDEIVHAFDGQSLDNSFFFIDSGKLYTMKPDGTVSLPISKTAEINYIFVSPNKEWFVLNKNHKQIELYSKDLQLLKSWELQTSEAMWRPDSEGLFLTSYPNLYYLSINDEELKLMDICPSQDCLVRDYIWLPQSPK